MLTKELISEEMRIAGISSTDDLSVLPIADLERLLDRLREKHANVPKNLELFERCRSIPDFVEVLLATGCDDPGTHLPEKEFRDRVAFISGSGHGIGRVIAMKLAKLGTCVIINSFHSREAGERTAADIRASGGDAIHVWGSVAKPDHVNRIFDTVRGTYGQLHYFVSNASNGWIGPTADITNEQWELALRTNLGGLHLGALRAAKLMPEGGSIVAITSPGAQNCIDHFGCQGTAKAGVEALLRYLASAFVGIRANAVSPGPVSGHLLNTLYPDHERLIPHWRNLSPSGQMSTQSDVCRIVLFLLSSKSIALNGAVVRADAGISLKM